MSVFLFLILVAVVLGIIGVVVNGLFYLLVIGIVIFLLAFAFLSRVTGRARRQRPAR